MKINFGLVAVLREELLSTSPSITVCHFTGYEAEPGWPDWQSLYLELTKEEEFGLIGKDFVLLPATQAVVEIYRKKYKDETVDN
jgi:hypothetical protein